MLIFITILYLFCVLFILLVFKMFLSVDKYIMQILKSKTKIKLYFLNFSFLR